MKNRLIKQMYPIIIQWMSLNCKSTDLRLDFKNSKLQEDKRPVTTKHEKTSSTSKTLQLKKVKRSF